MTDNQASALHVLIIEDAQTDAELMQRELRTAGLVFTAERVETREEFTRAIEEHVPDVILADYKLPKFDGMVALVFAHEKYPELPFVFVTGTLGEERAVEALQRGASDYILKDRMSRLGPAVLRAIEDARIRKEQLAAAATLRQQLDELRRFEKVAIGREQRMLELKEENTRLRSRVAELERTDTGMKQGE